MDVPGAGTPTMTIGFIRPLERAWLRARLVLFAPFDLSKWLGIGFAAWISGLANGTGGGLSARGDLPPHVVTGGPAEALRTLLRTLPWPLIAGTAVVALAVGLVLLWASSRGKFVFLHDVVHDRADIAGPWREYRREGNALFGFRLALAAGALVALALVGGAVALALSNGPPHGTAAAVLVGLVLAALAAAVVLALTALYTDSFVVPLMYRFRIGPVEAWRVLLRWIRVHPGAFAGYAAFVVALWFLVASTLVVVGVLTCCVALLLLAIPYLGKVLTLPIWVTYRALGPEFLAQFDSRLDVFAAPPSPSSPTAGGQPPPPAG